MDETKLCECGCGTRMNARLSNGKERHFWRGHGASRRVEIKCNRCGKKTMVHQFRIELFSAVFCSRDCSSKHRIKNHIYKMDCSICGIGIAKNRPFTGKMAICSQACMNAARAMSARKVAVKCSQCNTVIQKFPSRRNESGKYFCGAQCRAEYITGENNPAFSTGCGKYPRYGSNWKRQRRLALIRDAHACQLCGKQKQDTKKRELQVHHKIPVSAFSGQWEKANELANLITLCRPCHYKAECNPSILDAR